MSLAIENNYHYFRRNSGFPAIDPGFVILDNLVNSVDCKDHNEYQAQVNFLENENYRSSGVACTEEELNTAVKIKLELEVKKIVILPEFLEGIKTDRHVIYYK